MAAALVITFRESLEAILLVSVMLASLRGLGRHDASRAIWMAVVGALAVAIGGGTVAAGTLGSLGDQPRQLVFAFLGFAAVGVLSWIILSTADAAGSMAGSLRRRMDVHQAHGATLGVALLAGLVVLREGLEWLFLTLPILVSAGAREWAAGSALGLAGAAGVSFLVYRGSGRIAPRKLFSLTAGLLIVVAAGFLSTSVRSLQEARALGTLLAPLWDLTANRWVGHGPLAEFLAGLLGWNPRPSLEEALAWVLGFATLTVLFFRQRARRDPAMLRSPVRSIAGAQNKTKEALI